MIRIGLVLFLRSGIRGSLDYDLAVKDIFFTSLMLIFSQTLQLFISVESCHTAACLGFDCFELLWV